ncbi:LysR family transcriptional regulator [Paraburkholderia monticola]|uniref:LysR family transcriptional regulator n=1 Tax=Paraburkholderia monticola TaxID=1399968 RepID=A0A149PFK9_9BURK|nr:LysR substrate-binding domain-containing protein [Paraburkholderia monticola]KXU83830.1 LysR family transcriptional regulator [Paraburkholderia monticola]
MNKDVRRPPDRVPELSHVSLSRKLKLQQLILVAKVIDTGSLLRAAKELGMTQPAITKAVQELEAFFSAPLFERTNRGVVPTELGRLLGRRAKSMNTELRYLTDEINALQGGTAGHLIVGTLIVASARLLPMAIRLLKEQAPGMLVTVREAGTAQLFPALATGDLDIVVGRLPERELPLANAFPLQHEVLFQESICVVVGARHALALPKRPRFADLANLPWILPLADSPTRIRAEQLFQDAGLPLPVDRVESLSMLTNLGMLLERACVALMPRAAAQQFVDAGLLAIVPLREAADFGAVGFSTRADRQVSPACERFIACLRESAARIAG